MPDSLKKQYVKTYYSVYNKNAYNRLKKDYNKDKDIDAALVLMSYNTMYLNGYMYIPLDWYNDIRG